MFRYILALSLTLVAALVVAAEPDAELARARARAAIAIESAKLISGESEPIELQVAKLDAAEAIEQAKVDFAKPEQAPVPAKAPCNSKCTCGCVSGDVCRCVDLRAIAAPSWDQVLKAKGPVLVDFGATWCGPCRALKPTIDRLAKDMQVVTVDVDQHPDLVKTYSVRAIPRLLIFRDGAVVWDRTGAQPEATIRAAMSTPRK